MPVLPVLADPAVRHHLYIVHRRQRGAEVHQPLAVDGGGAVGAVGRIDANLVGGGEESCDQLLVGELIPKEMFHQREPAAHHGRGQGGATTESIVLIFVGAEIRYRHIYAGRRDAPRAGNTATVGETGDLETSIHGHRHDDMTLKFFQQGHRPDIIRRRGRPVAESRGAGRILVAILIEIGPPAISAMIVVRGKDKNRRILYTLLSLHFEMRSKFEDRRKSAV